MTLVDHPLEVLLRLISDAEPGPWRPLAYVQATESSPDYVRGLVELLRLEGLVEVRPGTGPAGPDVTLTPFGQQVLGDPEAMARLRSGESLRPDDPGSVIRESLRRPQRPVVTPILIALNFAVFLYCLYLASGDKRLARDYLMAMPPSQAVVERVLHPAGSVSPLDVLAGHWWRLLTACFVHAGILHLGMNMYTLHVAGRFVEQAWGRWRYLLIYLIAGWGGSCLALAMKPVILVGASGAICGVLAAEGVWVLLYGRYLPREMARRGRSQLVMTLVLLVVISLLPGVSGWGHAGGAIAGGAAALVLHFQRFGPKAVRWPALLLVLVIPVASYYHLQRERSTSDQWFRSVAQAPIVDAINQSADRYREDVNSVLKEDPADRDPAKVGAAEKALDGLVERMEGLRRLVDGLGPYPKEKDERLREILLDYTKARLAVFEAARARLRAGAAWTDEQQKEFDAVWEANERVKERWKEAE